MATISEKLQQALENVPKVYEAGQKNVDASSLPLSSSIKRVVETSKSLKYFFSNQNWNDETLEEALKYDTTESARDMSQMFYNNSEVTKIPVFDTSAIYPGDQSGFYQMFFGCSYLIEAPNICLNRPSFTSSGAANGGALREVFKNCARLTTVPNYDVSDMDDFNGMFTSCEALSKIPDFANSLPPGSTADYMFDSCKGITSLTDFDASNLRSARNMFHGCYGLESINDINFASDGNYEYMFYNTGLKSVCLTHLPPEGDIGDMFGYCVSLETAEITINDVPGITPNNSSRASSLFQGCSVLKTVTVHGSPLTIERWFDGCTSLTTVVKLDLRNLATSSATYLTFRNCNSLTDLGITNVAQSIQVASGTTYGHLLTVDSLVGIIYECRNTGSMKTLTIGSANLEKLANVYVKTIDITDEMRAEDDLIDEKLPFELCESSDENAMLINQYVSLKNWILQ